MYRLHKRPLRQSRVILILSVLCTTLCQYGVAARGNIPIFHYVCYSPDKEPSLQGTESNCFVALLHSLIHSEGHRRELRRRIATWSRPTFDKCIDQDCKVPRCSAGDRRNINRLLGRRTCNVEMIYEKIE